MGNDGYSMYESYDGELYLVYYTKQGREYDVHKVVHKEWPSGEETWAEWLAMQRPRLLWSDPNLVD